ncbi:unnamed protein product, partial [Rotaria sp. Silwood1]
TLSAEQIQTILLENKFTTLKAIDIEAYYKTFIKNRPSGELNEEGFIDEFKKLFPHSESINLDEITLYLEAVAELKRISTSDARFIADKVMKFCKKGRNEKLTKEEFINCMEINYNLRMEFSLLPVIPGE